MTPAGLYIHIPFCQAKCGYCSFNSIPADRNIADTYLAHLHKQALFFSTQPQVQKLTFNSIFFGGGTPTLASPEKLRGLLHHLLKHFTFHQDVEISIEANPNSIKENDLLYLRQAGFTRLSIGVQSFHNQTLKRLGRTHTGKQAMEAVEWGQKAGFASINCDLIYGLPQQTSQQWQDDLHTILECGPDHLSLYELSVDAGTHFHARLQTDNLNLPDDDTLADMEDLSRTILASTYDQYEISNYARTGHQCQHNLTYWHNGTYLGLGAGAVSCIDGLRFSHKASPHRFMEAVQQEHSTLVQVESLSNIRSFRETMVMGLRLVQGVDLEDLEQRTGLTVQQVYGSLIQNLLDKGYVQQCHPHLRIRHDLLGVANQILHQLV